MTPRSLLALTICVSACGGQDPGTLEVRIYGEEFIEDTIPASAFTDGWTVTFDRFLVAVGGLAVASGHGAPAFTDDTVRVYDLAQSSGGEGFLVTSRELDGGAYDHVEYGILPATAAAVAGNASAGDLELMKQGGYSVYLTGVATKGDDVVRLEWGFTTRTRYFMCHSGAEVDGDTAVAQLTIHGDHLFYDDLFAEEPAMKLDLVASADSDGNGTVDESELAAVDLSTRADYQVGSEPIDDLWAFIVYQTSTLGHIDGEGHCETARE